MLYATPFAYAALRGSAIVFARCRTMPDGAEVLLSRCGACGRTAEWARYDVRVWRR